MFDPPIFIVCRDRCTDLRKLVEWLERAGHARITLLDNASTYPPLLEFYEQTLHQVVRLGHNYGKLALWTCGLVPDEPFVLTDPDVIPHEGCPADLLEHLNALLRLFHPVPKAGVGFYLDDVPADMRSLALERSYFDPSRRLTPGVYASPIDTTFALYRAGSEFTMNAVRTGTPYLARHSSWYRDTCPNDEERYYLDRAIAGSDGSSWAEAVAS